MCWALWSRGEKSKAKWNFLFDYFGSPPLSRETQEMSLSSALMQEKLYKWHIIRSQQINLMIAANDKRREPEIVMCWTTLFGGFPVGSFLLVAVVYDICPQLCVSTCPPFD